MREPVALIAYPLASDGLERIVTRDFCGAPSLFFRGIRIDFLREQLSCFVSPRTRLGQRNDWIDAQRKGSAFACEAIIHSPVAPTIRHHEQIHAASIAELAWLGPGLHFADASIC